MENKLFLGKYRAVDPFDESLDRTQVLEAEDIVSDKKAILELIPAVGLKAPVLKQLQTEATAAMNLAHINIPALYDFGVEDDRLVYVTEYFDGTTAEDWVKAHGPMPTGAVLRIALQVMSALGAASVHRISHHAINPSNLMLVPGQTPEGDWPLVKVLHFVGLAPQFTPASVEVAAFDKSSHYASPEQLQHGKVDFRSEVYSLGCTMWFLLTGAPPLMAPNGPVSVQPTNAGLALDKLSGMPKGVRRLLGQMLSANPEARPQDPLAFYRQIQACLAQVERRETMARRFGLPSISRTHSVGNGAPQRIPMKALAIAAVLLALSVLAALVVPEYLRHKRVVEAQEPIGVPIGVPDASAAAVVAKAPDAPAPSETKPANPPAVASSSNKPAAPNTANENPPVAAKTDSATVASANQPVPPQTDTAIAAPDTQVEQAPPPTAEANTGPAVASAPSAPDVEESRPPAAQAPVTPKSTEVASADQTSSEPPKVVLKKVQPEKSAKRETVVTARPVTPEVRRAEPAPPAEGPDEDASDNSEESEQPANSTAQITTNRNVEEEAGAAAMEQPPSSLRPRNAAPSVASRAREKKKSRKEPNRRVLAAEPANVDEFEDAPPVRSGSVRAKFIGMTPDGRMMLALPSREVVIVPAPPGYR